MLNYAVLPDLIALAALVIVFRSMLRRHAGDQLDSWLLGWTFVLMYFGAKLLDDGKGVWENAIATIAVLSLEMAGLAFLRAASRFDILALKPAYLTSWTLGLLAYTACAIWNVQSALPYLVAGIALTTGVTLLNFSVRASRSRRNNIFSLVSAWILALTLIVLVFFHRMAYGIDLILTWLYLMAAVRCWQRFRGQGAGAPIAVGGFVAWSAVFPLMRLQQAYEPTLNIQSEMWNIPKYIVAVGILLTFLEAQIDRNEHLALHDPLTGLPNRRLFEDRLEKALQRAERNQTLAAVLLVDVDGFKQINDTYGHAVGDAVLRAFASRLEGRVRRADTIARTGGDEFTLVVADLGQMRGAETLAQKLREDMDQPLTVGELQLRVPGSIGVAVYPRDALSADALCARADAAMYEEKRHAKPTLRSGVER